MGFSASGDWEDDAIISFYRCLLVLSLRYLLVLSLRCLILMFFPLLFFSIFLCSFFHYLIRSTLISFLFLRKVTTKGFLRMLSTSRAASRSYSSPTFSIYLWRYRNMILGPSLGLPRRHHLISLKATAWSPLFINFRVFSSKIHLDWPTFCFYKHVLNLLPTQASPEISRSRCQVYRGELAVG